MSAPKITARRLVEILPPLPAAGPRYAALATALAELVGDGRLLVGTRMPSERDFTVALGVSRTTVTRAYEQLREQGHLASVRGSGSVVANAGTRPHSGPIGPLGSAAIDAAPDALDLTCAAPAGQAELLPWFAAALERLPAHLTDSGYHPLGLPVLREAIARRFTQRGLSTLADQIIVTTGGLPALATVARAFVGPGDRVLLENPTYPGAISAMRHAGGRLVGLPVGRSSDGGPADLAPAAATLIDQTRPGLALLLPDFHNPTGLLLGDAQRAALARVLRERGVRAVVDETLVETALDASIPMPAPFGLHARDAITVGSVSKSHWGGLRIGWIRAPRADIATLAAARLGLDVGVPVLEQLVVAGMFADGVYALPGEQVAHRRRYAALVDAVRAHLPGWSFVPPQGGLALWCKMPGNSSSALVAAARTRGTLLVPGAAFAVDGVGLERYLRLPFALREQQLRQAVRVIADVYSGLGEHEPVRGRWASTPPPAVVA
ncbi:DNA-binding transcriptional MocR family regulator [Kineosphaera limosa]|uniref:Putative GntR family transcriptional regulator n=1 Tax=Kineosphaera limosa NBRC 100340 TaxID=1184609 RepID=K6VEY8_9MICO|nr:PLP-dependent aminotransferase family protein [Kineosphaera limosa]NYD98921.1 DNA-binding transcriptional MocR family regulator [Kineosphaera limosa]GAB94753.1 putative GntR family transcriptional regulator [Kineosphaera limosa NBRC 100340]